MANRTVCRAMQIADLELGESASLRQEDGILLTLEKTVVKRSSGELELSRE